VCTKVWAPGFRNPFRFTLRQDGRLVLADVGWNSYEELNRVEEGERYARPCFEGPIHTPGYKDDSRCAPEYATESTAGAHRGPVSAVSGQLRRATVDIPVLVRRRRAAT
jgi:glucose/arabinose dehydrogenase